MFASETSSDIRVAPPYAAWTGGVLADPAGSTAVRLFCFPCAGAGASAFREWPHSLPRTVALFPMQLPGREGRFMELAHTEFRPLIEGLARALVPLLDVPFAFFGHSMGAIIAFELARELRRTLGTQPVHLFVAGARAPHLPDRDIPNRYLSDSDFVARLRHWNGIPPRYWRRRSFSESCSRRFARTSFCARRMRIVSKSLSTARLQSLADAPMQRCAPGSSPPGACTRRGGSPCGFFPAVISSP